MGMKSNKKYIGKHQGVFMAIRKKRLRIAMFILAGVLSAAAATIFLMQWNEGEQAGEQAEALLNLSWISQSPAYSPALIIVPSENTQPDAPAIQSPEESILTSLSGYTVIARLDMSRLDMHLPVLSSTSDIALKVSICYYMGVDLGMEGNLIIVGHNYRSGAHFGRLKELVIGDSVELTGQDNRTDIYTVYKIEHIAPDDLEALEDTQYAKELTLLTCEANGSGRLLVRCKADN